MVVNGVLVFLAMERSAARNRVVITSRLIADDDSRSRTSSTNLKVSLSQSTKDHSVQCSTSRARGLRGTDVPTTLSNDRSGSTERR